MTDTDAANAAEEREGSEFSVADAEESAPALNIFLARLRKNGITISDCPSPAVAAGILQGLFPGRDKIIFAEVFGTAAGVAVVLRNPVYVIPPGKDTSDLRKALEKFNADPGFFKEDGSRWLRVVLCGRHFILTVAVVAQVVFDPLQPTEAVARCQAGVTIFLNVARKVFADFMSAIGMPLPGKNVPA